MLALLFLCIITMITLILYISFFFSPSQTASNRKLSKFTYKPNSYNFYGLHLFKAAFPGGRPAHLVKLVGPLPRPMLVKLEIQDTKDLVNFHITYFENQLKNHFSAIGEGIDQSYTNKFQKSSDDVIEKLENIKATIEVKYNELSEALADSGTDISEINSKMNFAKTEVPNFVKNGLESFVKVFKNLKNEFSINKTEVKDEKNTPNSTDENEDNVTEVNKSDTKEPEKIDLASIPPEAIIRTIDTYLEDMKTEGNKLLNSVLLNDTSKSRIVQPSYRKI